MASRKEQAYKAAINHFFSGNEWDESLIKEYAGVNIFEDGTEIFFIADKELIRFGPLKTNTITEDGKVRCLFSQAILELY